MTPIRTLCVNYDLNRPGQDYAALIAKIKAYPAWWHCLKSTWIIKAPLSHVQVRDQLMPFIDANDPLLVVDITADPMAWSGFDQKCAEWLKAT